MDGGGDASDWDSLVTVGTGVRVPQDEREAKKHVPVHEQVVTDAQGRRRFHGAFTGGFSAGYFNTVGTKEGWTPSTFTSSRRAHGEDTAARRQNQRLEDFMDNEDYEDFGIAPRHVRSTHAFHIQDADDSDQKQTSGKRPASHHAGKSGYSEHHHADGVAELLDMEQRMSSLVRVRTDTMGAKLLKLMGWKQGQGLGARLTARQQAKALGLDDDDVDVYAAERGFTFAPRDVRSHVFKPKDDLFGIGYKGINVDDYHMRSQPQSQRRGAGFGVGAFEEDDDDIYASDDRAAYDRVLGESSSMHRDESIRVIERPGQVDFAAGRMRAIKLKKFPCPKIPPTYDPMRRARSGLQKRVVRPSSTTAIGEAALQSLASSTHARFDPGPGGRNRQLNAQRRAEMLGEAAPALLAEAKKRAQQALLKKKAEEERTHQQRQQQEDAAARAKAAVLSKVMAQRFTTAKGPDSQAMSEEERKELKEQVDDGVKAARMGMYGKLTRRSYEWHPDRILCKRFKLPDPYPRSGLVGVVVNDSSILSSQRYLHERGEKVSRWEKIAGTGPSPAQTQASHTAGTGAEKALALQYEGDKDDADSSDDGGDGDNAADDEPPMPKRPPMDLFKAIFSSGSDDSSDSSDGEDDNEVEGSHARASALDESNPLADTPRAAAKSAHRAAGKQPSTSEALSWIENVEEGEEKGGHEPATQQVGSQVLHPALTMLGTSAQRGSEKKEGRSTQQQDRRQKLDGALGNSAYNEPKLQLMRPRPDGSKVPNTTGLILSSAGGRVYGNGDDGDADDEWVEAPQAHFSSSTAYSTSSRSSSRHKKEHKKSKSKKKKDKKKSSRSDHSKKKHRRHRE